MTLKTARTLKLVIDHLPYRELSPNSRCHWAVKGRAVKAQRWEACILAKQSWRSKPPMQQARISYTFTVTNKRSRDIDNLVSGCKSFQDGLVDAGVIIKDDAAHLATGFSTVQLGEKEQTVIELQEVETL